MRGGQEDKKPQKMVRSSIACARCRRSKVKCVNNGANSTCKACASSNRDCTYPIAGAAPAPRRVELPTSIKQEGEAGESKKRVRKVEDTGRRNSNRSVEDVLDSTILTKKVWDELYEIFKLHFSTEMPFLHPPTFRNRMRQAAYPRDPSITTADLEDGRVLLLGVLALTARFHPGLVAHFSPNSEDPLAVSEHYASLLAAAFGPTIRNLTNPSLENIQALLMLGLYEWGQTRGLSAWLYVGLAIRLAFPMGLAYEDDPDQQAANGSEPETGNPSKREDAIEKEVRRRTVWSCFIMDRMLAAGKYRPTMMSVDKLRVQLPCSDDQFLFVRNVKTGFLNSEWLEDSSSEYESSINDDGVLSRYVRLVDIFGRLSEYSYAGGRRAEKRPPWDERTKFYQLRQQLKDFRGALPSNLTYTEANLSAHIEKRNATTYASLHTLYSLCLIMLHREYIPFIPIRCEKPIGPLDEPSFPEDKYRIPPGFWEESAEGIMKAARDIIDIVKTCQEDNALPESPLIGFAIYQAAFVYLYAAHFPQMDMAYHLVPEAGLDAADDEAGLAGLTKRMLSDMTPRLKMVRGYLKTLLRMKNYFHQVLANFYGRFKQKPPFDGGGLEEYKRYERILKEFGELKDADQTMGSDASDALDQSRSRASTNEIVGPGSNGEPMQGIEGAPPQRQNGATSWAPINATSPPVEVDERPKYNYGPAPYGPSPYGMPPYQQSPNQSSTAPSLMSPSNGETTPSTNSPYANVQQFQHPGQSQPQHVGGYPSVAQHVMAPPNLQQPYTDAQYEKWIGDQESIRMNTGFDNFAQETSAETWGSQDPKTNPNYIQAAWSIPLANSNSNSMWSS
ncbi:related to general repressor of transcription [Rhynchosporium secalis]|uniref:Related to general repressor of transcription n=1 Tax=Rhynchosporium secalis TaxID=38038 RepID=A0A1E1LZR1_RHYSE|nr:related to general repressor of transcription [Rhynchosporium secalis]